MTGKDMLLPALDVDDLDQVWDLVEKLSPHVGGFKIGLQLETSVGAPQACKFIMDRGGQGVSG